MKNENEIILGEPVILGEGEAIAKIKTVEVEGNKYKFRAECQPDIDALFELLPPENVLWWQVSLAFGAQFPDRVCEIELSGMMLDDLKNVISKIPDGHVMLETVAELKDYTGER